MPLTHLDDLLCIFSNVCVCHTLCQLNIVVPIVTTYSLHMHIQTSKYQSTKHITDSNFPLYDRDMYHQPIEMKMGASKHVYASMYMHPYMCSRLLLTQCRKVPDE